MGASSWHPPAPRLPGPHAHYALLDHLGTGGQGVVWYASDARQPNEPRAIKFFREPRWGSSPALVDAFFQEAFFGIQLRSHHLGHTLELLDLRQHPEWPPIAMVMDYYACSLFQVLGECDEKSFKFPASRVARWARQLVLGLEDMHDRYQRVHRDVKPGNILFRLPRDRRYDGPASLEDAEMLLSDFGTTAGRDSHSPLIVFHDPSKDPLLYPTVDSVRNPAPPPADPQANPDSTIQHRPALDGHPTQHCTTAMDVYSLGLVLRALAGVTAGNTRWLTSAADDCMRDDPAKRPRAADLFLRLAPDWDEQVRLLQDSGWDPDKHWGFTGRRFLIDEAFPEFVASCGEKGGVFAVVGPAGVGKTALLNKWCEEVGQPFGFFFRYNERDNPEAMPERVAEQLVKQFRLEADAKKASEEWATYLEGLCRKAAASPGFRGPVLLFVDGLDEAADAARAVSYLPKRELPKGVYVVVSTRPHAKGEDHVAKLRDAGARLVPLEAGDPKNLKDLHDYVAAQLRGRGGDEQLGALAAAAGGIFLLARLLVEAVREGEVTAAEALARSATWAKLAPSQRLFAYYAESWKRACANEDEVRLADLAQLLAAVFGWVSTAQVGHLMAWYDREDMGRKERHWTWPRVKAVLRSLGWFLDRRKDEASEEFSYQIRHQSVRDYLLSEDGPVLAEGVREMHGSVARYYCGEADRDTWPRVGPYGRFYAVRHLVKAGDKRHAALAAVLLADLGYMQGTLGDESPAAARRGEEGS